MQRRSLEMKKKTSKGWSGFAGLKIEKRLKKAFNIVTIISTCTALIGLIAIVVVTSNFKNAMANYALPQGDIALFMNEYAECHSDMRGLVAYSDAEILESLKEDHAARKAKTYERLAAIEKTMVTPEGRAAYAKIAAALEEYFAAEAEVVEIGATNNSFLRREGQAMAAEVVAPLYNALDEATLELMQINIEKEHEMEQMCNLLENAAVVLMAFLTISIVVISRRVSVVIANGISHPLNELSERLEGFEKGDISSPFPEYHEADEIGDMVQVVSKTTAKLQVIFADLEQLLNKMADGNFNIRTSCEEEYIGEYQGLLMAIRQMNRQMDTALKDVRSASEMVSAGSINLAEGAQVMAEGATDQAASVQEIQASMDEVTVGLEKCASDMVSAYDKASSCVQVAESSQVEMKSMMDSMERISETSGKIESIIAEIEDIASQTNLLSLNAAIEAARAGDAGRGFAVVADQIRNLADQSARSAVSTRELIESSVNEVNAGKKAAMKTAEVLDHVVASVEEIAETSRQLDESLKLQVESIEQVGLGINRISEVVQNNSATAEETSATSEELSAQAASMDEMVGRFQLRD